MARTALTALAAVAALSGCAATGSTATATSAPAVCLDALYLADEALGRQDDAMLAASESIAAGDRYLLAPVGSAAEAQALADIDGALARFDDVIDWIDAHAAEYERLFDACEAAS